jgi:hypothetical protein
MVQKIKQIKINLLDSQEIQMPSVARFRGITIYIYTEQGAPHRLPHFHVYYAEYLANLSSEILFEMSF